MRILSVMFDDSEMEERFDVPDEWNPDFDESQEWLVVPASEDSPSIAISLAKVKWLVITNGPSA